MSTKLVVTAKELKALGIPYSLTHLYRLMDQGEFPRSVKLSRHRTVWLMDEVQTWLAERVADRDAASS